MGCSRLVLYFLVIHYYTAFEVCKILAFNRILTDWNYTVKYCGIWWGCKIGKFTFFKAGHITQRPVRTSLSWPSASTHSEQAHAGSNGATFKNKSQIHPGSNLYFGKAFIDYMVGSARVKGGRMKKSSTFSSLSLEGQQWNFRHFKLLDFFPQKNIKAGKPPNDGVKGRELESLVFQGNTHIYTQRKIKKTKPWTFKVHFLRQKSQILWQIFILSYMAPKQGGNDH